MILRPIAKEDALVAGIFTYEITQPKHGAIKEALSLIR